MINNEFFLYTKSVTKILFRSGNAEEISIKYAGRSIIIFEILQLVVISWGTLNPNNNHVGMSSDTNHSLLSN